MARISGIELQDNWKVDFALTRISGIGWPLAKTICRDVKIEITKRLADLTGEDLAKLAAKVEDYPIEGELLRMVKNNITRLKQIGTYRGLRHGHGLPVRGQRTKTNARTKRGKRKTVGAFKKEALAKTLTIKKEGAK